MVERHCRRSVRLEGYDYGQAGGYFVTLVTEGRVDWFGEVVGGEVRLNGLGQMAAREWQGLPGRFARVVLDVFVVMPDHLHGLLMLRSAGARGAKSAGQERLRVVPGSLGALMRVFKSVTTLRFHHMHGVGAGALWQRNYYEHIVRGPDDLERIRAYIQANAVNWELDQENKDRKME